jgi:hypothetical protein
LAQAERLIIVSQLTIWGLSPWVKAVLERSLANLLPFMTKKNGQWFHEPRQPHPLSLLALFYGPVQPKVWALAQSMIKAIGFNLSTNPTESRLFSSAEELEASYCP